MADHTFSRARARREFGTRFVDIMMKDRGKITLSDDQYIKARRWRMICEGGFWPFLYDYVYIISDGSDRVKVGYSMKPKSRYRALSNPSSVDLIVRKIFVLRRGAGRNLEKAAHRLLKSQDRHIKNEWFEENGVVEIVSNLAESKYPTSLINMDAAWTGSEELMPVARFVHSDDQRTMQEINQRRDEFLWVATLARSKYSVDLQDILR